MVQGGDPGPRHFGEGSIWQPGGRGSVPLGVRYGVLLAAVFFGTAATAAGNATAGVAGNATAAGNVTGAGDANTSDSKI